MKRRLIKSVGIIVFVLIISIRVSGDVLTPTVAFENQSSRDQDDMCVWMHPDNLTESMIITSDKKADYIFAYSMDGQLLQQLQVREPGNIDIRYGYDLDGVTVDLVAVNVRKDDTIELYAVDRESQELYRVDDGQIFTANNYGSCMYKSPITGEYFVFIVTKRGLIEQYQLRTTVEGLIAGDYVREFSVGSISEGMVCDDETGYLYVGQEDKGIWRFSAEPSRGECGELIIPMGETLKPDVEGLTIYYGDHGEGYLIASSQRESVFHVYERKSPHAWIGEFEVEGVTNTDGIDVVNLNMGEGYSTGVFLCHNGSHAAHKNVGVIYMASWDGVAFVDDQIDTSYWDPREGIELNDGVFTVNAEDAETIEELIAGRLYRVAAPEIAGYQLAGWYDDSGALLSEASVTDLYLNTDYTLSAAYDGILWIDSCNIKAGKDRIEDIDDDIKIKGLIDSYDELDRLYGMGEEELKDVTVSLIRLNDPVDGPGYIETLESDLVEVDYRRGRIKYKNRNKKKTGGITELSVDLIDGDFVLKGEALDLTGFASPMMISLEISDFVGYGFAADMVEDLDGMGLSLNGFDDNLNGRKDVPLSLLSGYENMITVEKLKYRESASRPDTLQIDGELVVDSHFVDLVATETVVYWGETEIVVPVNVFEQSRSKQKYGLKDVESNGFVLDRMKVDFEKNSYSIKIKGEGLEMDTETVDFGFKIGDLEIFRGVDLTN